MNFYQFFSKIYRKAAERMCLDCLDFIKMGSKIIDLGCGSAIVGKTFQEFFKADLIGVDVRDDRVFPIPFELIDGKLLPFPENSFDVALVNHVLHHTENPRELLEETKRVVKDKIIVYEDLPEGYLSEFFCKIHGKSFDKLFNNPNKTSFKGEKEWEKIFKETGLKIIFKKRKNSFPIKKELFILGV